MTYGSGGIGQWAVKEFRLRPDGPQTGILWTAKSWKEVNYINCFLFQFTEGLVLVYTNLLSELQKVIVP